MVAVACWVLWLQLVMIRSLLLAFIEQKDWELGEMAGLCSRSEVVLLRVSITVKRHCDHG